jgi:hypothetical protein
MGGPVFEDRVENRDAHLGPDAPDRAQVAEVCDHLLGDVVALTVDDDLPELGGPIVRQL